MSTDSPRIAHRTSTGYKRDSVNRALESSVWHVDATGSQRKDILYINEYIYIYTEGGQTLCWRFDDELWTRFRNVIFIQLCIFCFSTVKVANILVNIVILQWYGISKGYLLKMLHQKELYLSFSR